MKGVINVENNKIIDVQDMLFTEMKRLSDDNMDARDLYNEINRATSLYNTSTNIIKAINTNLTIMNTARRLEVKKEVLMKELGL